LSVPRVALITGGAQGIGAGAARKFLSDGFAGVVLLDRNAARLAQEAHDLRTLGKVETLVADLRDEATPARAVAHCMTKFGRIDVLVNAAGDTSRGGIDDTSPKLFDQLFDVNVKAPFFLMQQAAVEMVKVRAGVIINISSMIAYGGPPNLAAYSATKAALVSLTKHAAQTYAWQGVRTFAINLGWALTEGEQNLQTGFHKLPNDWSQQIGARMPAGRLIAPADIADLCAYLVSPSAQMMNGTVIDFEQMPVGMFRDHPALKPEI
jgi:NAD(P)-dependent dehydrogenase (short-subunit alcohol dehydrogenase family)